MYASLTRILERHRLDEDDIESIRGHHWDYWCFPSESGFDHTKIREAFPEETEEILQHASYVTDLPGDYFTSAIITEHEGWIDLQDFGWRMIDEPCRANQEAAAKWAVRMAEILESHDDKICIQIITHC